MGITTMSRFLLVKLTGLILSSELESDGVFDFFDETELVSVSRPLADPYLDLAARSTA